jgi:OmpA-OmpF porin, OOP family
VPLTRLLLFGACALFLLGDLGCRGHAAGPQQAPPTQRAGDRNLDRDSDKVPDARDRCPARAEDLDGFADADGCPDDDDDGDGVPDATDLCVRQPEDHDRFEDADGCPDPDNDKDRVADNKDGCPNHAEVYNNFEDDDGCPDPRPYDSGQHGSFTDNLFTVRPVFFDQGSSRLRPAEARYLTKLAGWLASEPAVEVLAVVGHASTDEPGPIALGHQRARVVAQRLGRTIGRARLRSHSAGTSSAAEWAMVLRPGWKDRSVHFRYFRLAGKEIYRWSGTTDVPVDAGPVSR